MTVYNSSSTSLMVLAIICNILITLMFESGVILLLVGEIRRQIQRPKFFHLVLHLLHKKSLFLHASLVFSQHQTCTQRVLQFKDSFGENLSGMGFVCVLIQSIAKVSVKCVFRMASAFVPVDLDKLLDEFEEKEQGQSCVFVL